MEDAELVVAELVTNALLHGTVPVTLRLQRAPDRVRIEVEDKGRDMPIRLCSGSGAMSGRGLGLVAALVDGWGAQPGPVGGKVVWAELADRAGTAGAGGEKAGDLGALLVAWPEEESAERRYTVVLGPVPTDLLLAAKAHIDNLFREFTFAAAASAERDQPLPAELAGLVQTVVHGFAAARSQIKRQAAQSAEQGAAETHLTLTLPASAAAAGEVYLAALDDADRYARAARLLTGDTAASPRVPPIVRPGTHHPAAAGGCRPVTGARPQLSAATG
jgi:Histidine kinase-like ATPase domain